MKRYTLSIHRADYDITIVNVWARNARSARTLGYRYAQPWTRAGLAPVVDIFIEGVA